MTARRGATPALEWAAAGIGLALVLLLLGLLVAAALDSRGETVPLLAARVERVEPAGDHHVVTIRVANRSGITAADVAVEGVLTGGAGAGERSQTRIDYVAGRGETEAGLLFRSDPRRHRLELRIVGFASP